MRKGEFIIVVREHTGFERWSYAEYKAGILISRYTPEELNELKKNNQVVIL